MRSNPTISSMINNLPNAQVITKYLCIIGLITCGILALCLLLFLLYLLQCLLLSIGEVVHTFNTLDPLVRFLIFLFVFAVVGCYHSRKNRSAQHGYA